MTTQRTGLTLFETPIGWCGVAWNLRGIVGVQLPESTAAETRARLVARCKGFSEAAPPASVEDAIARMIASVKGHPSDLSNIILDMDAISPFYQRVYDAARTIPFGATTTYGELASRLGARGAARAVGQALGRNPFPLIVPCHRVLAAGGKAGGFSAMGGVETKMKLLAIEGMRRDSSIL